MTMAASEMIKKSGRARLKKHGGKKGFAKHVSDIANKRFDKRSQTTPNRKSG
jgi:hypothetical protein